MNQQQVNALIARIEALEARARKTPGKLVRWCAGGYFVFVNAELLEISHEPELSGAAKWIVREKNRRWYSDPFYTLAEAKESLKHL